MMCVYTTMDEELWNDQSTELCTLGYNINSGHTYAWGYERMHAHFKARGYEITRFNTRDYVTAILPLLTLTSACLGAGTCGICLKLSWRSFNYDYHKSVQKPIIHSYSSFMCWTAPTPAQYTPPRSFLNQMQSQTHHLYIGAFNCGGSVLCFGSAALIQLPEWMSVSVPTPCHHFPGSAPAPCCRFPGGASEETLASSCHPFSCVAVPVGIWKVTHSLLLLIRTRTQVCSTVGFLSSCIEIEKSVNCCIWIHHTEQWNFSHLLVFKRVNYCILFAKQWNFPLHLLILKSKLLRPNN